MKILIADDDRDIAELMELYLKKEGFHTVKAFSGTEAAELLAGETFDLILLDIMMPGISGYTLIKDIKERSSTPVIFVSARTSLSERILGLDMGADDYIIKPFEPLELIARVKAVGRRTVSEEKELIFRDLRVCLETCRVYTGGREAELTSTEFSLLSLFLKNQGRVLTKETLFNRIWPDNPSADENMLRVHLRNLRQKIDGACECEIKTLRGLGYRLQERL